MTKYDAIIIGSGQAGNPLARKLAATGRKVAIIEKGFIGGTCVNVGCTPTKTMIASGRVAYLMNRSMDFGVHVMGEATTTAGKHMTPAGGGSSTAATGSATTARPNVVVDIEQVIARKNAIVLQSRESNTKSLLETHNLEVVFGTAAFSGDKQITVVKEDGSVARMTADWIFVNAGTRPSIPVIDGLSDIPYYDSSSLQDLLEIPRHLLIIGGSYIALEFGQLYRRLGSQVTIIEDGPRFLPKEDEDIAGEIRTILQDEGLNILVGCEIKTVRQEDTGSVTVELHGGEAEGVTRVNGTHVLVATGREPNTETLHPELAGIGLDHHGFIKVNDRLETNVPGIFALGDVKGGPQFTHISYNDHLVVYKNLVEGGQESIKDRVTIYCLFTDPELGRIGMTETEARKMGLPVQIAKIPATHIARAIENGDTRGLVKAVVHAETKQILGVAALTQGGGELMSILQMAMAGGVPYDRIKDMVFAHPTFAESLNNLFAKVE